MGPPDTVEHRNLCEARPFQHCTPAIGDSPMSRDSTSHTPTPQAASPGRRAQLRNAVVPLLAAAVVLITVAWVVALVLLVRSLLATVV
jgi:hypothetical protein